MKNLQADDAGTMVAGSAEKIWKEISIEVESICAKIFESTNKVLQAHLSFGFTGIAANIHPKLEDILLSLDVVQSMLDRVSSAVKFDHSEERIVSNSKQMIWCIEGVALALKNECQADYDTAIAMMRAQAQF